MTGTIVDFMRSEKGATAIEYVIIASLIALGLVGTLTAIGGAVRRFYQSVADVFH